MDIVPVFPLPNAVLFPGTVLPLHVFEPRYLDMVRDAVAGEGHIAVSLLAPGYESHYEGSPAFHRIGTVGRIEQLETLADGRYNLHRVEFDEIPSSMRYRLARLHRRDEADVDERDAVRVREKLDLLASHAYLLQQVSGQSGASLAANERLPFRVAVNGTCANMPVDAAVRQALLEIDSLDERRLRAQQLVNEVLGKVLALKSDDDAPSPQGLN